MSTSLSTTLGALEIGSHLLFLLFGILTIQTYLYWRNFPEDSKFTMGLVAITWLVECAHTILYAYGLYNTVVFHNGEPIELAELNNWAWAWSVLLGAIVAFSTQTFFAYRLYHGLHQRVIAAVAWIIALIFFLGGLVIMIKSDRAISISSFTVDYYWLIALGLSMAAAADILITWALCYNLLRHRRMVIHRTAKIIDKIVVWTISTGLLTSIVAIITVICAVTMENNYIYLLMDSALYKLYSNTLLANLNSRSILRSSLEPHIVVSGAENPETAAVSIAFASNPQAPKSEFTPSAISESLDLEAGSKPETIAVISIIE